VIVLRTPKGWTGPKEVDGKKTENFWRSHQVPLAEVATNDAHLRQLEQAPVTDLDRLALRGKRAPNTFLEAARRLGVSPARAVRWPP
jgi:beta-phosphoglucomutase-like phosphatase (HAD superfamily)